MAILTVGRVNKFVTFAKSLRSIELSRSANIFVNAREDEAAAEDDECIIRQGKAAAAVDLYTRPVAPVT